jgi:hypothetical protein
LYIYVFLGYDYLTAWRRRVDARKVAARVLSQVRCRQRTAGKEREKARCVLLKLSRHGEVRLISVRYDEGRRNMAREDITTHLTAKGVVRR